MENKWLDTESGIVTAIKGRIRDCEKELKYLEEVSTAAFMNDQAPPTINGRPIGDRIAALRAQIDADMDFVYPTM